MNPEVDALQLRVAHLEHEMQEIKTECEKYIQSTRQVLSIIVRIRNRARDAVGTA